MHSVSFCKRMVVPNFLTILGLGFYTSVSLKFWHCANVCMTDNENWVGAIIMNNLCFFANFNSYVSPCEHTSKSLEFWHCANVCVTDNENWVGVHWDKWAMFVLIHCKSATKLNRGCFLKWLALRSCCTMYRSFRYRSFRALQRYAQETKSLKISLVKLRNFYFLH